MVFYSLLLLLFEIYTSAIQEKYVTQEFKLKESLKGMCLNGQIPWIIARIVKPPILSQFKKNRMSLTDKSFCFWEIFTGAIDGKN